jgi:hypothetical protein
MVQSPLSQKILFSSQRPEIVHPLRDSNAQVLLWRGRGYKGVRDIEVMRCVQDDTCRPTREEVRSREMVIIRTRGS